MQNFVRMHRPAIYPNRRAPLTIPSLLSLLAVSALLSAGCRKSQTNTPLRSPSGIFRNRTTEAGIGFRHSNGETGRYLFVETTPGGCALLDYDNDGWLDLLFVQSGSPPGSRESTPGRCVLYHNEGKGRFREVTAGSGLEVDLGYGHGIATGDYDNDGLIDLYVTAYGGNKLFHNLGHGQFEDVTDRSGVSDREGGPHWSTSAVFGDFDNDGLLDLFVCHYCVWSPKSDAVCLDRSGERIYCEPTLYEQEASRLYRNEGKGIFRDITRQAGLAGLHGRALGAAWLDYDGDGWQDLYVANDMSANFLFQNKGNGAFREVALNSGVAYSGSGKALSGMGIGVGDYDNDGREDLYVTNFSGQTNSLYHNDGGGMFTYATESAGLSGPTWHYLGFGTAFFDYNRDGLLDLIVGNGHVNKKIEQATVGVTYAQPKGLYRNLGKGQFAEEVTARGDMNQRRVSRGLAIGDYDNDGRIDVLACNQNDRAELFRNDSRDSHHWISLRLIGTRSNRSGFGARVTVEAAGKRYFAECRSGFSYLSASDPRVFFGLGTEGRPVAVTIEWPGRARERLSGLTVDRFYVCTEGQGCKNDEVGTKQP